VVISERSERTEIVPPSLPLRLSYIFFPSLDQEEGTARILFFLPRRIQWKSGRFFFFCESSCSRRVLLPRLRSFSVQGSCLPIPLPLERERGLSLLRPSCRGLSSPPLFSLSVSSPLPRRSLLRIEAPGIRLSKVTPVVYFFSIPFLAL